MTLEVLAVQIHGLDQQVQLATGVVQQQGLPTAATREDDVVLSCLDVVEDVPHVDVRDRVSATALHAQVLIDHQPQFRELLGSSHRDLVVCHMLSRSFAALSRIAAVTPSGRAFASRLVHTYTAAPAWPSVCRW